MLPCLAFKKSGSQTCKVSAVKESQHWCPDTPTITENPAHWIAQLVTAVCKGVLSLLCPVLWQAGTAGATSATCFRGPYRWGEPLPLQLLRPRLKSGLQPPPWQPPQPLQSALSRPLYVSQSLFNVQAAATAALYYHPFE